MKAAFFVAALLATVTCTASAQESSTQGGVLVMPPSSGWATIACRAALRDVNHCVVGLGSVPLMEFVKLSGYKRIERRGFLIQNGVQYHVLQVE